MDERKIPLPYWLPWATTAIFAAVTACIGENWIVEKTRSQILKDDSALVAAELKAVNNQLEAERIVNQRLVAGAGTPIGVSFLVAPEGAVEGAFGAVVWSPLTKQGYLLVSGLRKESSEGVYQLWVSHHVGGARPHLEPTGPWSVPVNCGVFPPPEGATPLKIPLTLEEASFKGGHHFTLTYGKKGHAYTFDEAVELGSIVLASSSP